MGRRLGWARAMKPYVIHWAMSAGRNFELRDECMSNARKAVGTQRELMVHIARRHHRIAMDSLGDARRSLAAMQSRPNYAFTGEGAML